jgi:hypothetical protein
MDLRRLDHVGVIVEDLEHIAFDVGDLEVALGALGALGVEPNAPPRRLPDRSLIWTEPATSGGIMFQFVQRH